MGSAGWRRLLDAAAALVALTPVLAHAQAPALPPLGAPAPGAGEPPPRSGVIARTPEEVGRCRREELARIREHRETTVPAPAAPLRLRSAATDLPDGGCERAAARWGFYVEEPESGCFVNAFGDKTPETVIDLATGLMWKRGASPKLSLKAARAWVAGLNAKRFEGYGNWRLPTVEELLSLIEYGVDNKTNTHLDGMIFEAANEWWSADRFSPEHGQWVVSALTATCRPTRPSTEIRVRAVRSVGPATPANKR